MLPTTPVFASQASAVEASKQLLSEDSEHKMVTNLFAISNKQILSAVDTQNYLPPMFEQVPGLEPCSLSSSQKNSSSPLSRIPLVSASETDEEDKSAFSQQHHWGAVVEISFCRIELSWATDMRKPKESFFWDDHFWLERSTGELSSVTQLDRTSSDLMIFDNSFESTEVRSVSCLAWSEEARRILFDAGEKKLTSRDGRSDMGADAERRDGNVFLGGTLRIGGKGHKGKSQRR